MFNISRLFQHALSQAQHCRFTHFIMALAAKPLPEPESTGKMQAWQIDSYGTYKQLQLKSLAIPYISDSNQLLIKVKATALNPIDLGMLGGYGRSLFGLLRFYKTEFPLVLGREFAGTIIDKGRSVSDNEFKIGDEVYGIIPVQLQGCQREYLLADKSHVLLRPAHLSVIEAASVLYTAITAWSALFLTGGLGVQRNNKPVVLILGASGGIGTVSTQMLKSDNSTVIGICSTDAVSMVTSLGADYVYDYKDPEHIHKVAAHGTFDIILDCAKYGHKKIPATWKYKTFITLNSPLAENTDSFGLVGGLALSAGDLIATNAPKIIKGQSVRWAYFSPQSAAFKFIDKLIRHQQLKPVIEKVFKFGEVPEAFDKLAAGHLRGKIVINLQDDNQ